MKFEFKSYEQLKAELKAELDAIERPFIRARKEREAEEQMQRFKDEIMKSQNTLDDTLLLRDDEEFDINNKKHQDLYISYSLPKFKQFVEEYVNEVNKLNKDKKYSKEYKKEKKEELKKELFKKRDEELFNIKARLYKIRTYLQMNDEEQKEKKDANVELLEKIYTTNLIEKAFKYKSDELISDLIKKVASDETLTKVFKLEASKDSDTLHYNIALDKELEKANEKYKYLDKLERNIEAIQQHKNEVFIPTRLTISDLMTFYPKQIY